MKMNTETQMSVHYKHFLSQNIQFGCVRSDENTSNHNTCIRIALFKEQNIRKTIMKAH